MYLLASIVIIAVSVIKPGVTVDVCNSQRCQCSKDLTIVNCDTKGWKNLEEIDFPSNVITLTLVQNNLKFDTDADRTKINNLLRLKDLSLNQNPLGVIPPFSNTKIQSLSLQDTSLTSAEFPLSYNNSFLQTISLSNNKIRSIHDSDLLVLSGSKVTKLNIDSASISSIDRNAFIPLNKLQALSLKNNQLKSCDFLFSLPSLSSIKLDENRFTSLPPQLAAPGKMQTYSFKHNSITVIDESSPLKTWLDHNQTNMKIYLANNSFDCCSSLWFIRFLRTSPHIVGDALDLTCATPGSLAGKLLHDLNPDEIKCGGDIPSKSWWTMGRVIGIVIAFVVVVITIGSMITFILKRRYRSRSGYERIGGRDEPSVNVDSPSFGGPAFPNVEDDYETLSNHTYIGGIRNAAQSEAPTYSTMEGAYAADISHVEGPGIQEAVVLPGYQ